MKQFERTTPSKRWRQDEELREQERGKRGKHEWCGVPNQGIKPQSAKEDGPGRARDIGNEPADENPDGGGTPGPRRGKGDAPNIKERGQERQTKQQEPGLKRWGVRIWKEILEADRTWKVEKRNLKLRMDGWNCE